MRHVQTFTWSAYAWTGALALIASWVLSTLLTGCRFGNHVEGAQGTDSTSGYYALAPQTLKFCATVANTTCATSSTTKIPNFLAAALTDPVALILRDPRTGKAAMTDPSGQGSALPVFTDPTGASTSLSFIGSTYPATLWTDSACTTKTYIEENGSYSRQPGTKVTGFNQPISGRITLDVTVTQTFDGDCVATLKKMHACYLDSRQCGGATPGENDDLHAQVLQTFAPYIASSVMADTDIPSVVNLVFEATYQ